jgi:2-(1,2-epoxy-1,2-dihydrophenyl)acetyl-CoA isomerase
MSDIETGTTDLLARVEDGVGILTMNRPERRNALSGSMISAMGQMLARFEIDPEVGAVVLTGAGGAFCAGGDVKAMAEANAGGRAGSIDERIHQQRLSQRATSGRLWEMPKPTIAALPGPAAGAGLSLALACDLRYAVSGTMLTTAFARVGFSGDYGGTWLLTRLVGAAKARELYYFSDRLPVEDAERLGIINAVYPPEAFDNEVMTRARRLAEGPRVAYRYMKENLNRAVNGSFDECLDLEATHHTHTGLTEDHREAARAFVERRDPEFHGR